MVAVRKASVVALVSVALFSVFSVAAAAEMTSKQRADCTADLNPQGAGWTVKCKAPHEVTIRVERWWHELGSSAPVYNSKSDRKRQVEPGKPWSDSIRSIPEQLTDRICLTAYEDGKRIVGPRCHPLEIPMGNRF